MDRMTPYYTVLFRDNVFSPFSIHFGSFDRDECKDEQEHLAEAGYRRSQTKIITTTCEQSDIDQTVDHLNATLV